MELSQRVLQIKDSITLKLNAKANQLSEEGRKIYNLTAGQLPFRPDEKIIKAINSELKFLKSFQYSPVLGFLDLRAKLIDHFYKTRKLKEYNLKEEFDCLISNGGKHSITNVLSSLIDQGDEVIILAPYWVSYPQIIKLFGGRPVIVDSNIYSKYTPSLEEIKNAITDKTKAIIVNSPSNPSGIHYSDEWMKGFAGLMKEHEKLIAISDEIYFDLYYYDPAPTYFYQHDESLLERTIIVDGISKNLASTGLRVGYTFARKDFIKGVGRLQAQTTSGANSLVQRALMQFDFDYIPAYLSPIKDHLRENVTLLHKMLRKNGLETCIYQSYSAFYYLIDFSKTPILKALKEKRDLEDYADEICQILLEEVGVALVPGGDFGLKNVARISLVSEKNVFEEALELLMNFLNKESI